jgi:biopolymer transport protein ExbD
MAMTMGTGRGRGGVAPIMNVTPLVDVVLVLLIMFMVLTPMMNKKFWIHTPKQEKKEVEPADLTPNPTPPLVLQVTAERVISVNGTTSPTTSCPDACGACSRRATTTCSSSTSTTTCRTRSRSTCSIRPAPAARSPSPP